MVEIVEIEHLEIDGPRPGGAERQQAFRHLVGCPRRAVGTQLGGVTTDRPGTPNDLGLVGAAAHDLSH